MIIKQVTVDEFYAMPDIHEVIAEYSDIARTKNMPKPIYKKEDYLPYEAAGVLAVWVGTHDKEIEGFATCLMSKMPHYGVPVVITESIFVRERSRKSGLGMRLIKKIEDHGQALGAQASYASANIGADYCKVLERKGYVGVSITFVKALCS